MIKKHALGQRGSSAIPSSASIAIGLSRAKSHNGSAADMYSTERSVSTKTLKRVEANAPLFPLINASPYRFVTLPPTCSSVCSIAMFMYPSRHDNIPKSKSQHSLNNPSFSNSFCRTTIIHPRCQPHYYFLAHDAFQEVCRRANMFCSWHGFVHHRGRRSFSAHRDGGRSVRGLWHVPRVVEEVEIIVPAPAPRMIDCGLNAGSIMIRYSLDRLSEGIRNLRRGRIGNRFNNNVVP